MFIRFIRGCWVHSGTSLGSSGFVEFNLVRLGERWVHSGEPWWSLGSSMVVGFTRVPHQGRWVHLGSLGSHACAFCGR